MVSTLLPPAKYVTIRGANEDHRYFVEKELPRNRVRLRCCKTRTRSLRSVDELIYVSPPEHTFFPRIKFPEWEHLVFVNAQHYRACWKRDKQMHGEVFPTFPEAIAKAEQERGMVAAVCATGRHIPLGKAEWPKWLSVWNSLPGVKAAKR